MKWNRSKASLSTSSALKSAMGMVHRGTRTAGAATTHMLPTELIDVVEQHLDHDPDVSQSATCLYLMLVRVTAHDAQTWTTEGDFEAPMDATASTIEVWFSELEWSNVIVRGWDSRVGERIRLADVAELRAGGIAA
jgi:hypothetical protein